MVTTRKSSIITKLDQKRRFFTMGGLSIKEKNELLMFINNFMVNKKMRYTPESHGQFDSVSGDI